MGIPLALSCLVCLQISISSMVSCVSNLFGIIITEINIKASAGTLWCVEISNMVWLVGRSRYSQSLLSWYHFASHSTFHHHIIIISSRYLHLIIKPSKINTALVVISSLYRLSIVLPRYYHKWISLMHSPYFHIFNKLSS